LDFDAEALTADVAGIAEGEWIPHFNIHHHDGGWSGVAVRAGRRCDEDLRIPTRRSPTRDAAARALPGRASALASLRCPVGSARFLRLAPGSASGSTRITTSPSRTASCGSTCR
jgi:hypothetical protein